MHRIDGGAAGLGVQRGLRIVHHVDAFERVDFTAYRPVWGLRPEGGPDGALNTYRRESPGVSIGMIQNIGLPEVAKKTARDTTITPSRWLFFVKSSEIYGHDKAR